MNTTPPGIEIQFSPFRVRQLMPTELPSTGLRGLPDILWCFLPDILLSGSSRTFVGLSFAVDDGQEVVAEKLCGNSTNVRLVRNTDSDKDHRRRYSELGRWSRLEVMWSHEENEHLECELASLSDGYWVGFEHLGDFSPFGYRLLSLPALVRDHELRWPQEIGAERRCGDHP